VPANRAPSNFLRKPQVQLFILGVVTLVSRLAFTSPTPVEWDSVQLALGVENFDVSIGSPHAPGYWIWITLAEGIRMLTWLDAHESLVLLSALSGAAAVILGALVGNRLGGRWLATSVAAVLFASPHMWFYGAIAATYLTDVVVVLGLLLIALRARPDSRDSLYAALLLGLGAGLRPTMLLIYGPLCMVTIARSVRSVNQLLVAASAGAAVICAWLVPLVVEQPGGLSTWRETSSEIFDGAAAGTSIFENWDGGIANMYHLAAQSLVAMGLIVGLGIIGFVYWLVRVRRLSSNGRWALVALVAAIVPPVVFAALIHFAKGGYVLSYMPAVVVAALWAVSLLRGKARLVISVLVACICLAGVQRFVAGAAVIEPSQVFETTAEKRPNFDRQGLQFFRWSSFGAPYPFTADGIDSIESDLDRYAALDDFAEPGDVVVFSASNGGHRFRNIMFSNPELETAYIADNAVIWTASGRETESVSEDTLPVGTGRAIFALDGVDDDQREILDEVVLNSGASVWIGRPGDTVYGVSVTE
jgi:hypothetical protein